MLLMPEGPSPEMPVHRLETDIELFGQLSLRHAGVVGLDKPLNLSRRQLVVLLDVKANRSRVRGTGLGDNLLGCVVFPGL